MKQRDDLTDSGSVSSPEGCGANRQMHLRVAGMGPRLSHKRCACSAVAFLAICLSTVTSFSLNRLHPYRKLGTTTGMWKATTGGHHYTFAPLLSKSAQRSDLGTLILPDLANCPALHLSIQAPRQPDHTRCYLKSSADPSLHGPACVLPNLATMMISRASKEEHFDHLQVSSSFTFLSRRKSHSSSGPP